MVDHEDILEAIFSNAPDLGRLWDLLHPWEREQARIAIDGLLDTEQDRVYEVVKADLLEEIEADPRAFKLQPIPGDLKAGLEQLLETSE